jgi:hypothetical protein
MARGGYTPEQVRGMSQDEIYFIYYYQNKVEEGKVSSLAEMLGVMFDFDKQTFSSQADSDKNDTMTLSANNKLYVPLSFIIQPEFAKKVSELSKEKANKKSVYIGGGEYRAKDNENIVSMSELSKDEFLALIGRRQ